MSSGEKARLARESESGAIQREVMAVVVRAEPLRVLCRRNRERCTHLGMHRFQEGKKEGNK